ncbi:MAG: hypothetical protein K2H13_02935, partial [Eubacterium sp.]|nr:hypothetical protein [Eubacterium sp.]
MKSKILIIAMAVAVIATVFMGCAKDNDKDTTSTTTTTTTTTTAAGTTDNATTGNGGTSDTTNEVESKANNVGDDIGQGV